MGRERRVHHAEIPGPGAEIRLAADEAHHVERVLRLGPGAELSVFDGRGREWRGEILETGHSGTVLRVGEELLDPVEASLPVRLYQGLCRPDRMELAIQKGTELGLLAIHPLRARRAERERVDERRIERWRRIAREAAKQSGRRRIPRVEPPGEAPAVPEGVLALVLDPSPDSPPIARLLERQRPGEVWLAVGPEGGFTPEELVGLASRGWAACRLGPRTLRTETAGLVAAALVLHRWDDLGGRP